MQKKLFLLDAFALIFRAYYALIRSPRITSSGKNTNAQFGFTNTILELLNNQQPTHMAVCFDTAAPTDRHTDFADYKANRQETPEDISAAVPDIINLIKALNIPVIAVDGFEADDVIGTLAKQAEILGYEVFMVTPDKDYGQLVSQNIKIYKPGYQGGKVEIMGPAEVCSKWNVEKVDQVIDLLGLMGDAVDNIPGIKGVGEKTAAKLLGEYGSLENVLANSDSIKGSMGEKIRAGKEDAILSKKLATIITNAPIEFHEENFLVKAPDKEKLKEVFEHLEFRTLGKRILGEELNIPAASKVSKNEKGQISLFDQADAMETFDTPSQIDTPNPGIKNIYNTTHEYIAVTGEKEIKNLISALSAKKEISFDTETTGIDPNLAELVGMSFSIETGKGYYVPCPPNRNDCLKILKLFGPLFLNKSISWVGQNIKFDLLMLKWYGMEIAGPVFDTMLANYVIDPDGKRGMDDSSMQYLGYEPVPIESLIGKKGKSQGNMRDVELEEIKEYAVEDADITLQLKSAYLPFLKSREVEKVFYEVENPLVKVLTDMEFEGIRIDESFLKEYSKELARDAKEAEEAVYLQAGVRFNLASPKQLGEVLFEKLNLVSNAKKTRTGQYATGEDVLLKLAPQHQICSDILNFRELTKLRSTYVDALPLLVNSKTGRVHTSYAQAVAVTGRLSSNNPNLQNIPVRTDKGKEIRKAFIPRDENHILVSADYSQIELRIVAAISGDKHMCDAFREGKDIHTATAAKVFSVDEAEVTKEMRYKAKSVNFGIIYGQGAFGLAENLGISRTEAKEIIENYKLQYPDIQKYMDHTIQFAKKNGYVQTLMGRKRWLRDINSANFTVRSFAERNAINSPIQGTAADMIKLAMIKIHQDLIAGKFKSKMLLQVHDELVFDVHKSEFERIKPVIISGMQQALTLPNEVSVIAETGHGKNWLEAH
ncbi:MAG: DNA polymerase I [Ferruginibacter sp.]|nr:DNA polymerase I [Ferruginibacter sp.]